MMHNYRLNRIKDTKEVTTENISIPTPITNHIFHIRVNSFKKRRPYMPQNNPHDNLKIK